MESKVIVRGRGLDLAAMFIWSGELSFEQLRDIFRCPMRITKNLSTNTWHVDLTGEPRAAIEHVHQATE